MFPKLTQKNGLLLLTASSVGWLSFPNRIIFRNKYMINNRGS